MQKCSDVTGIELLRKIVLFLGYLGGFASSQSSFAKVIK